MGRITSKFGFDIEFSLETPIMFKIQAGEDWGKNPKGIKVDFESL